MKRMILLGATGLAFLAASTASVALGFDGKDDVKNAVKKLADQANYSWKTTTTSESQGKDPQEKGATLGKTEKGGVTLLTISKTTKSSEAALQGGKVAVKTADGWKNAADFDPKGDAKGKLDKSLVLAQSLQKFVMPLVDAATFADQVKEFRSQEGVLSGELTEEGVKAFIAQSQKPGQKPVEFTEPKVIVKFWLRDGTLAKYEVVFEAKKPKGKDKTPTLSKTTTTVELMDVGSTKVEVSEDARKKLQ
jgi:hypothetical protein